MKKKAVILFMASILALGVLTGCGSSKTETSVTESRVASEQSTEASVVESSVASEQSTESSVLETEKTVKVTSVKGITFERPDDWTISSESEEHCGIIKLSSSFQFIYVACTTTENINKGIMLELADVVVKNIDYIDSVESEEEVFVNGKYARKIVYTGTDRTTEQYMIWGDNYLASVIYTYDKAEGATYAKEFVNIVNSIQFETVPEYSKEENSKVSTPENASSKVEVSKEESSKTESTGMTMGQSNALKRVLSDLEWSAYSRAKLIENLEDDKYSHEDAVFAVDNCGADWNEQALREAKSQLEYSNTSRADLLEDLVKYEKFTQEQAEYAVDNCGADWNEQALKSARSTLEYSDTSRADLLEDLVKYDGFTQEQAEYAVNNCGADWNEQAVKAAKSHLEYSAYSRDELIEWLVHFDKFTQEQAEYAVKQVGY